MPGKIPVGRSKSHKGRTYTLHTEALEGGTVRATAQFLPGGEEFAVVDVDPDRAIARAEALLLSEIDNREARR